MSEKNENQELSSQAARDKKIEELREEMFMYGWIGGALFGAVFAFVGIGFLAALTGASMGAAIFGGFLIGVSNLFGSAMVFGARYDGARYEKNKELAEDKILYGVKRLTGAPFQELVWGIQRGLNSNLLFAPLWLAVKIGRGFWYGGKALFEKKERVPGEISPMNLLFEKPSYDQTEKEKQVQKNKRQRLQQPEQTSLAEPEAKRTVRLRAQNQSDPS